MTGFKRKPISNITIW